MPEKIHGNRLRSKEKAYEVKKARSKLIYEIKCLAIDPYWKNEKIIRNYYNLYGKFYQIDPSVLENEGFRFDLTKSVIEIEGYRVEMMNKFGYTLLKNKKIILWKH